MRSAPTIHAQPAEPGSGPIMLLEDMIKTPATLQIACTAVTMAPVSDAPQVSMSLVDFVLKDHAVCLIACHASPIQFSVKSVFKDSP